MYFHIYARPGLGGRGEGIGGDAVFLKLRGKAVGHADDAGVGGAVLALAQVSAGPGGGGAVHYAAPALVDHVLNGLTDNVKMTGGLDGVDSVPHFLRHVLDRAEAEGGSDIHNDVELAVGFYGSLGELAGRFVIGDVAEAGDGLAAGVADLLGGALGVAVILGVLGHAPVLHVFGKPGELFLVDGNDAVPGSAVIRDDLAALGGKRFRHSPAYAHAGAGNYGDSAFKIITHLNMYLHRNIHKYTIPFPRREVKYQKPADGCFFRRFGVN